MTAGANANDAQGQSGSPETATLTRAPSKRQSDTHKERTRVAIVSYPGSPYRGEANGTGTVPPGYGQVTGLAQGGTHPAPQGAKRWQSLDLFDTGQGHDT